MGPLSGPILSLTHYISVGIGDTGMRLAEAAGLLKSDIILD